MSQCFSASLWCTGHHLLCVWGTSITSMLHPKQSLPHGLLRSVNPFKLSSRSWQQTFTFYVGGHSHFNWCYFQSICWGTCWRHSPILNLILEGHMFHWLQTHLPPHCLLLLHIPDSYCAFYPAPIPTIQITLSISTSVLHSLVCLHLLFTALPYASICLNYKCGIPSSLAPMPDYRGRVSEMMLGWSLKSRDEITWELTLSTIYLKCKWNSGFWFFFSFQRFMSWPDLRRGKNEKWSSCKSNPPTELHFLLENETLQFRLKSSKNSDLRKLNWFVSDFFQIWWIKFAEACKSTSLWIGSIICHYLDSILFDKAESTENRSWEWKLFSNSKFTQLRKFKCSSPPRVWNHREKVMKYMLLVIIFVFSKIKD